MQTNTCTIGGLPCYDPPEGVLGLNSFTMRTGAARYGSGAFLMIRRDYDTLVSRGTSADLVMAGPPGPGLTLSVVIAGEEPVVANSGDDASTDAVRVIVYDQRATQFAPLAKFYNVPLDGYPLLSGGGGDPACYASTLNSSALWTWAEILNDSGLVPTGFAPPNLPTWKPYNLVWDNVPAARVLDDVAAQLFYVVGYDHQFVPPTGTSASALPTGLRLFSPRKNGRTTETTANSGFQANVELDADADAAQCLLAGWRPGEEGAARRNYARLPGKVNVTFRGVGDADPYSGTHRYYRKVVNTGFGKSDYTVTLHVGTALAVWSGSAWTNQAKLDAIASDLAHGYAEFMSQVFGQAEYAGIWPFRPDGRYRQIEWTSNPRWHPRPGARTVVRCDNMKDWLPSDAVADPVNLLANQSVVGLGTAVTTVGPGGTVYAYAPPPTQAVVTGPHPTRGGCYLGSIWKRPTAAIDMTTVTAPILSEIGSADPNVIVMVNKREISKPLVDPTQWDIDVTVTTRQPHVFDAWFAGYTAETPPRPFYLFDGSQSKNCS